MDENGNRADMLVYGASTWKRTNLGRLYEQAINAASRDLSQKIKLSFGFGRHDKLTPHQVETAVTTQPETVASAWAQLLEYYSIVAPVQYELMQDDPEPARHVAAILTSGIFLYCPPDQPGNNLDMMRKLMASPYRPHYGPVTYTDLRGETVTTYDNILIGSMYMLVLEKTGEDWSGAASIRVNHFGIPAKISAYDRDTSPGRQQGIRALGEPETRTYCSNVGPEPTMELLDQSNNATSRKMVVESILRAPKPTNIDKVVDRTVHPLGGSRPVTYIEHLLRCRGVEFVRNQPKE